MIDDAMEVNTALTEAGADIILEKTLAETVSQEGVTLADMKADLMLIVGSDRTLLSTLLELGRVEIPILPVASRGYPGFLFNVTTANFDLVVEDLTAHQWTVDRRARLEVDFNGQKSPPILNEVAIFAKRNATLIRYSLYLNEEEFWRDGSDGLIISTPTGSTAYSMSVGGPVVLSSANVFTIIPVNSTNPARKPLILSDKTLIQIRDLGSAVSIEAILDGQERRSVNEGPITIRRSSSDAVFVKLTEERLAALHGKILKKVEAFDDLVQELPPSAKLVLKVLQYQDQLTQKQIIEETLLPPRTVRHALSILISEELVRKRVSLRDSRQALFTAVGLGQHKKKIVESE